jgi:GNAT superfamily N-acetyltransferase
MNPSIQIKTCIGTELIPFIPKLAELRIEIFRDFPYLYDGTLAYEYQYLKTYSSCSQAFCALVFDKETLVGATTGIPLSFETPEVKAPFLKAGIPDDEVFYFGESILKKAYRGTGIGIRFFKLREEFALSLPETRFTAFCGVVRPENHPRSPKGYKPLNIFWQRMGYEKQVGMTTHFSWKDLDEQTESPKEMQFWMKSIR